MSNNVCAYCRKMLGPGFDEDVTGLIACQDCSHLIPIVNGVVLSESECFLVGELLDNSMADRTDIEHSLRQLSTLRENGQDDTLGKIMEQNGFVASAQALTASEEAALASPQKNTLFRNEQFCVGVLLLLCVVFFGNIIGQIFVMSGPKVAEDIWPAKKRLLEASLMLDKADAGNPEADKILARAAEDYSDISEGAVAEAEAITLFAEKNTPDFMGSASRLEAWSEVFPEKLRRHYLETISGYYGITPQGKRAAVELEKILSIESKRARLARLERERKRQERMAAELLRSEQDARKLLTDALRSRQNPEECIAKLKNIIQNPLYFHTDSHREAKEEIKRLQNMLELNRIRHQDEQVAAKVDAFRAEFVRLLVGGDVAQLKKRTTDAIIQSGSGKLREKLEPFAEDLKLLTLVDPTIMEVLKKSINKFVRLRISSSGTISGTLTEVMIRDGRPYVRIKLAGSGITGRSLRNMADSDLVQMIMLHYSSNKADGWIMFGMKLLSDGKPRLASKAFVKAAEEGDRNIEHHKKIIELAQTLVPTEEDEELEGISGSDF